MQNPKENVRREESRQEVEPSPLEKLVRDVAEDAQRTPEDYIRESIVPEGGE